MRGPWRVEFEDAFIDWLLRQRPSHLQICAVIRWLRLRRTYGPPEDFVHSPDPERPEDMIGTVPAANVDVIFLAYASDHDDNIIMIREFTSF